MSISIRSVSKSFGATLAIEDVSFDLTENSFVSIVGPSGCGKSTLLRLVAGLIPPSGGTIIVRDRPVDRPLRDIGMVFQSPVLLPWRTTLGNILFVAEMGGMRSAAHRGSISRAGFRITCGRSRRSRASSRRSSSAPRSSGTCAAPASGR